MEELNGSKTSLGTIVITVIITAIVFGGGVYLLTANKKIDDQKTIAIVPTKTVSVTPTAMPSVSTSTTTATDETANWKTYTNSTYKISFKYPTAFTPTESVKSFDEVMGASCQTVILDSKTSLESCDAVANMTSYGLREPNGMEPTSTSDLTIGGRAAKKYISGSLVSYVILSPTNNRVVLNGDSSSTTVLEQILSTLKFN